MTNTSCEPGKEKNFNTPLVHRSTRRRRALAAQKQIRMGELYLRRAALECSQTGEPGLSASFTHLANLVQAVLTHETQGLDLIVERLKTERNP